MIPLITFTFNHFHSVKHTILGSFSVRHILAILGETAADITRTVRNTRVQEEQYLQRKQYAERLCN
jgi:hypothetical protein